MNGFVVVDVGCIECGENTSLIGVFDTEAGARRAVAAYAQGKKLPEYEVETAAQGEGFEYFAGGQHRVVVLPVNVDAKTDGDL